MSEPVFISALPIFYDMQYVQENKRLTSDAFLFNEQMFKTLDAVVNQFLEGIRVPNLTAAAIVLQVADTDVPDGTFWYDETNDLVKIKVAGVEKTVTVT